MGAREARHVSAGGVTYSYLPIETTKSGSVQDIACTVRRNAVYCVALIKVRRASF